MLMIVFIDRVQAERDKNCEESCENDPSFVISSGIIRYGARYRRAFDATADARRRTRDKSFPTLERRIVTISSLIPVNGAITDIYFYYSRYNVDR